MKDFIQSVVIPQVKEELMKDVMRKIKKIKKPDYESDLDGVNQGRSEGFDECLSLVLSNLKDKGLV